MYFSTEEVKNTFRTCQTCGEAFETYVYGRRLPQRCLGCLTAKELTALSCSVCGSDYWRYSYTFSKTKPTRRCVQCVDVVKKPPTPQKETASYQRNLRKSKEKRTQERALREEAAGLALDKFCPKCEVTKLIDAFEPTQTGRRKNCIECNLESRDRNLKTSYQRRAAKQRAERGGKSLSDIRRERLLAYYATNPDKQCGTCGETKQLSDFVKDPSRLSGRGGRCKNCERTRRREAARQKRTDAHLMEPPKYSKPAAVEEAERKAKRRAYKNKYRQDPMNRINRNFSEQIRRQLRDMRSGKSCGGWKTMVGYTLFDLRQHLEAQFKPGMSWENYGAWHIDHIKPKAAFQFTSPEDPQFAECWALENLRPLWAEENVAKGAKYSP